MSEFFMGQIIMGGFGTTPRGFAACDGQILPVQQNRPLFSLIGDAFGGDNVNTFGLPDMRGRAPVGVSKNYGFGARGGVESVTLTEQHLPSHTHSLRGATAIGDLRAPNYAARTSDEAEALYAAASGARVNLAQETIEPVGNSMPANNMQPFCTVQFIVALTGVFPTRP